MAAARERPVIGLPVAAPARRWLAHRFLSFRHRVMIAIAVAYLGLGGGVMAIDHSAAALGGHTGLVVAAAGSIAGCLVLGRYMRRTLTEPIIALELATQSMALERLDVALPYLDRLDEIGNIARSLELLRMSLLEKEALARQEQVQAAQLQQAEKELIEAEKLASLGRLVAGIAHEINTPLGSALMVATTLEHLGAEFRSKLGRPIQREDLEQLLDDIDKATGIQVRALSAAAGLVRDFKQVAVDQHAGQPRRFALGELVEQVLSTLRPTYRRSPHRIATDIPADLILDSFPGPLGQVVSNLVINALVHGLGDRPPGTVSLSARRLDDGQIELVAADDGAGIAPEHLGHIFEPFYTTRFGQGGSGLGLHIVHAIVTTLLHGRIDVRTAPQRGTSFILTLPADRR